MWVSVVVQVAAAFVVADIVTGVYHWLVDSYIPYCTRSKVPGMRALAVQTSMHHYYPREILLSGANFLDRRGVGMVMAMAAVVGAIYILARSRFVKYPIFFLLASSLSLMTNSTFHRWQHMRDCERPLLVTLLYRTGCLVSDSSHRLHHTMDAKGRYCIYFPMSNTILDGLGVWRWLEWCVEHGLGIKAKPQPTWDEFVSIHTPLHHYTDANTPCPRKISKDEYAMLVKQLDALYGCHRVSQVGNLVQ